MNRDDLKTFIPNNYILEISKYNLNYFFKE